MADDFEPWQTKGGLFGAVVDYTGLDPNTIAQLSGTRWTANFTDYQLAGSVPATRITYWLPQEASEYKYVFAPDAETQAKLDTFAIATPTQQDALLTTLNLVGSYTLLTFAEATSADTAALRFDRLRGPAERHRRQGLSGRGDRHPRRRRRLPVHLERIPITWNRTRFHVIGIAHTGVAGFTGHIPSG